MTIGEKLRDLRISQKITQSELCGDMITRNMLSRIENGAALPSLPTLQYLSNKLGVSAGYFLDDNEEVLPYRKIHLMPKIKELYRKGDFASCLALAAQLDSDDEAALITAESLLNLGIRLFREEQLHSAEGFFERAITSCRACLYDLSHIEKTAAEHLSAIKRAKAEKLPDFPPSESSPYADQVEYYLYVYMLYITKNTRYDLAASIYDTIKFSNTLYKKHINARLSILARNNSRASNLLLELVESFETVYCDPLFRMNVLTDMESVSNTIGDYKNAYNCLVMKNKLLSAFES